MQGWGALSSCPQPLERSWHRVAMVKVTLPSVDLCEVSHPAANPLTR